MWDSGFLKMFSASDYRNQSASGKVLGTLTYWPDERLTQVPGATRWRGRRHLYPLRLPKDMGPFSDASPLTFFSGPWQARLGSGKSGSVGMAHCPLQLLMAWGVLPPARSVREPLMGTCGLIAGS